MVRANRSAAIPPSRSQSRYGNVGWNTSCCVHCIAATQPTASDPTFRITTHEAVRFAARGFTLFELLLVLVILLIVGGITFSNVQGLYEKKMLQEAAQAVRTELAAGRLNAIDSGAIYQFQYEYGGTQYSLQPFTPSPNASAVLPSRSGELPGTMHFESQTAPAGDVGEGVFSQNAAGFVTMVLFLPDGTASDAAVDVVDSAGRSLMISVRGLTAAATVSTPRRESRS